MTAKTPLLLSTLFAFYLLTACNWNSGSRDVKARHPKAQTNLHLLKKQKAHIDSLVADTDKLITLVKTPNNTKLVLVKGNNWPDEIETTYNLYKDSSGKVIYAVEIPESESGDWFIAYRSYFVQSGKLFAFVRQTNFFNTTCQGNDGVIYEKLVKYYDSKFRVADTSFKIVDQKGKRLKQSDCMNDYNLPYKIINTIDEYLKANYLQGH